MTAATTTTPKQVTAAEARTFLQDFVNDVEGLKTAPDETVLKLHAKVIKSLEKHGENSVAEQARIKAQQEREAEEAKVKAQQALIASGSTTTAAKPPTTAEFLASAPPEIRASIESGMRMHEQHKTQLITKLTATNRCKFTAEQLKGMDVPMLENLVELAAVPDYSGMAPAGSSDALRQHAQQQNIADGDQYSAPPPPRLGLVKTETKTAA